MGRLDGKVALITGGARGMGKSHVRHFVAEGARVVLGDVLDGKGSAVADALGGQSCRYVHHDVTSEADWDAAVATAVDAFGRLDVLVNNAGVLKFARIADMTLADFRQVLEVNAIGCWLGMRAVIGPMTTAGGGLDHQYLLDRGLHRGGRALRLQRQQVRGPRDDQGRRAGTRPSRHPGQLSASGRGAHQADPRRGRDLRAR